MLARLLSAALLLALAGSAAAVGEDSLPRGGAPCTFNLIDQGGALLVRCEVNGTVVCFGVVYAGRIIVLGPCPI